MNVFKKIMDCCNLGISEDDDEELKIKKSSMVLVSLITGSAGFALTLIYLYFDHAVLASIPLVYTAISLLNLLYFKESKNIISFYKIQTSLILVVPFLLMWSLGGFALGSFVFIWAFFAPIAALIYENKKQAFYWFCCFIVLVTFSVLIDQYLFENHTTFMPQMAVEMLLFLNITAGLSGIYYLIQYFVNEKEENSLALLQQEHGKLIRRTEELKKANSKLHHYAHHDALTNLPNRYYLRENLEKMISHAKRHKHSIALLFIDLDDFKGINDDFGHSTGDQVLLDVSSRIKSLLREEDTIARLGGDEFAVVISDITDISYIDIISERIIDEVNRDYSYISKSSPIGVSIGISLFPQDAQDIDTLIDNADEAMYEIKLSSKNAYKFYKKESSFTS